MDQLQRSYKDMMLRRDMRVDGWLLMSSPFPTIIAVLAYLIIVWQGPHWMKNRKPVDLKKILVFYNFTLVLLSVYMVFEFVMSAWLAPGFSLICQAVDYSNEKSSLRLLNVIWWYYFSKIIEFWDTFFFILRKKNSQITFLHILHHSTMPLLWWVGTRFHGGGESYFSASLNSLIHVLMYSYYMLSAMGPAMQRYLWWKKYLTTWQLMQFGAVMIKSVSSICLDCGYSLGVLYALVTYMVILIALFSNFYYQTYLKKLKSKDKAKHVANGNGASIHKTE